MIKFQKISKALILSLAVVGLFSCDDNNGEEVFDFIGDVFITKRIISENENYGISYYAYGTQPISMAKVSTPDAEEIELNEATGTGNTWLKLSEIEDFTTDVPTQGSYLFTVTHEGIPHEDTDELALINMEFSEITTNQMIDEILNVEWSASSDADGHVIRLLNEAGDMVFGSAFIPEEGYKLEIGEYTGTGNWMDGYPTIGDTYTLELHAFSFENGYTDEEKSYHIEEIAISEKTVTWE